MSVIDLSGFTTVGKLVAGRAPLSLVRRVALVGLLVAAWMAANVGVASAASAWWHVASAARPSYLHQVPGGVPGQSEVQELTIEPGSLIELEVGGQKAPGGFETEPGPFEGLFPVATASGIQAALEVVYGKGNVSVTGGGPEGTEPFLITSVGEDADVPVAPVRLPFVEGPSFEESASVRVVTAGRAQSADGQIAVMVANRGDATVDAAAHPVTITDQLPAGLKAVGVEAILGGNNSLLPNHPQLKCVLATLVCTLTESIVPPFVQIEERIDVVVEPGAVSGEVNSASVSGGAAPSVSSGHAITVSPAATPFGVQAYEVTPEEEGGGLDTQAGSHPFQTTFTLALNQEKGRISPINDEEEAEPAGLIKDFNSLLPAGFIGNPDPFPRCTLAQFSSKTCPAQTVLGVASVHYNEPRAVGIGAISTPVFNLEPSVGEPARFGFLPTKETPVFIDTSVRTGGDYGITGSVSDIVQTVGFFQSEVTFWGVPGDPRHDSSRGLACLEAAAGVNMPPPCRPLEERNPPPFFALPTSCTGEPLSSEAETDSWADPGDVLHVPATSPLPTLDGCNRLPFAPTVRVTPDDQEASTPSGLDVDVHVPQDEALNPQGLSPSDVRDISVTLPEGVTLNPAGADGLEACSEQEIGYLPQASSPGSGELRFTSGLPAAKGAPAEPFCPDASKIGTVKIKTPLLPNALEGAVYLASQDANPFGSLVAMYIVAEDPVSGSLVKLPGQVTLDQATGQITGTFVNQPQLPFEDAELHFFGGERAPLSTPAHCGTYTTNATYTPWSGGEAVTAQSSFEVKTGPNGGPCPGAALAFSPSLTGGTVNNQAGAFSPFTMTMSREDGEQNLKSIQLHMPPGLSGVLTGVPLCDEADADAGTCPAASLIGETIVSVGLGGNPYSVKGGKVYLTGPYRGAPFGLSIVNPAVAGPFDLGQVIVRAKLEVDPHTAAVTVTSDESGPYAIPPSIDGIPLQIKHVNVTISRPGFTFNPTNCTPLAVTGSLQSIEGASAALSVPFQATNCAVLKFAPKFAVSTSGKTSKANGASLNVKLTYPQGPEGTYANIARVKVDLPKALPSRLTTLQQACVAAVFEANPARCPAASIIGHAKATTPLIPVPLEGPAYFVSHGGEAFPSLIIVLQGYNVTLDLVGTTFISKAGITSSTFKTVPDAPVGSFELNLPEGKYSALAANGNLCKDKLAMPTEFLAQNGAKINESTTIAVTGCHKTKKAKAKKKHKAKKAKRKKH